MGLGGFGRIEKRGWVLGLGVGRVRLFDEVQYLKKALGGRRVLERHAERTGNGNEDTWHA